MGAIRALADFLGLRTWRYVRCEGCGCQVGFRGRPGDEVHCGACGTLLPGFEGTGERDQRSGSEARE